MALGKRVIAMALLTSVVCFGDSIAKHSRGERELRFSAEHQAVGKPVHIPEDVAAILRKDELVRTAAEHEGADSAPISWFSAFLVHLSASRRPDLLVIAEGPLMGSNVTTFWVFRGNKHGHRLVLTAPAHDLILKKSYSNRHRDIELVSLTAVQISRVLLRYDGQTYQPYRSTSERIQ